MKLRDLTVGQEYYHEVSTRDWNLPRHRDAENITGEHRVRLLDTRLYRRTVLNTYVPATPDSRGTYVRVMFVGSSTGGRDREGYVSLASLRAPWGSAVAEASRAIAERQARVAEAQRRVEDARNRAADLVSRARQYGLYVESMGPVSYNRPEAGHRFRITETDLSVFLEALDVATRELSSASTGGTE